MSNRCRSRGWCFTINNPTAEEKSVLESLVCEYLIVGDEVAETGTPHLQGFVYFANQRGFNGVKKCVCPRAHVEKAAGTAAQNRAYCSKQKILLERGKLPDQGARCDLDGIKQAILEGKNVHDIIGSLRSLQQLRFAEGLMQYQPEPPREKPFVSWFFGGSGLGKTRTAREEAGSDIWMSEGKELKWFSGYWGQAKVIIDDFKACQCELKFLLRLLDRYPMRVEFKGGWTWWRPTHMWLTASSSPESMFGACPELFRRIDLVREFKKVDSQVEGNTTPLLVL